MLVAFAIRVTHTCVAWLPPAFSVGPIASLTRLDPRTEMFPLKKIVSSKMLDSRTATDTDSYSVKSRGEQRQNHDANIKVATVA